MPLEEEDKGEESPTDQQDKEEEEETADPDARDPADGREPNVLPDPGRPTEEEVAKHSVTHLPYRAWCPDCVKGKAQGMPHFKSSGQGSDQRIPTISYDYGFASEMKRSEDGGEVETWTRTSRAAASEEDKQDMDKFKVLVVKDERTKTVFAHAVKQKGVDEDDSGAKLIVKNIEELGYRQVSLKCDQEPSTMAVLKRLLRIMNIQVMDQVLHDHPAVGDSQSNGSIENGVKTVMGQLRTMKTALESRIGAKLPLTHPVMDWMTEYAGQLLARFGTGHDGRTPYERLRGKPFNLPLPEFAETVWKPAQKKNVRREERGKLNPRWSKAIYLGLVPMSTEVFLWDGERITKARGIRRTAGQDRWSVERIQSIAMSPGNMHIPSAPRAVFEPMEPGPGPDIADPGAPVPLKDLYVRKADLLRHGFTEGCKRCDSMRAGTGCHTSHNRACRARISEALGPEDPRVQRITEKLADDVEARVEHDKEKIPDHDHDHEKIEHEKEKDEEEMPELEKDAEDKDDDMFMGGGEESEDEDLDEEPDEQMELCALEATEDKEESLLHEMWDRIEDAKHIEELIAALGGNPGKHRKRIAKKLKAVVSEIYSPPRVTAAAKLLPDYNVLPGMALDLTTSDEEGLPWDFSIPRQRARAKERLQEEKPMFLIGTPMCTAFCRWQKINDLRRTPEEKKKIMDEARLHLRFTMELYHLQLSEGRYFIHEHPAYASSWDEDCTRQIMELAGTQIVLADQCRHGMKDRATGNPVKKPTKYMSNAPEVLKELGKLCRGGKGVCGNGRPHQPCSGRTAKEAGIFPLKLCRTILKGMKKQMEHDGRKEHSETGVNCLWERELQPTMSVEKDSEEYYDDVTGQPLIKELVLEARAKEMAFFENKKVLQKVLRGTAWRVTGRRPIGVRWVDVNKGDDVHPEYRSRLVAKHIRYKGTESAFAAMPPVEAVRVIVSLLATALPGEKFEKYGPGRMQLSVIDIKRAYFNAIVPDDEPHFVELPPEDPDHGRYEGRALKYMYGLQKAAEGWERHYTEVLEGMGFTHGRASPCMFLHREKGVYLTVYGDDFTARGPKKALDWYEERMKQEFELTVKGRLGHDKHDDHELRVLNRVVRVTKEGIEYEADPRHAEELVRSLDLENGNPCVTPGVKETVEDVRAAAPLDLKQHTPFRAAAARCSYLCIDRPDCQFASKEVCRLMAAPTSRGWAALKRIARYLLGKPRLVHKFPFQSVGCLDVYSDTDWAGCPRTRKSTSGGAILLGSHTIKTWSSTQGLTSLSSGEAEWYGLVKAVGQGLGLQGLLSDLEIAMPLELHCDSSAARGIARRRGLGKLRHIELQTLWIQEKLARGAFRLHAVPGKVNPADLCTKHLPERCLLEHLKFLGCELKEGRAASAPKLRGTETKLEYVS